MTLLELQELKRSIASWTSVLGAPIEALNIAALANASEAGALIWDVRSSSAHAAGHPVGARSLGSIDWLLADDSSGGNLIPRAVIAARLATIGLTAGQRVIVYAEPGCLDALVALRALRAVGVRSLAVCEAPRAVALA